MLMADGTEYRAWIPVLKAMFKVLNITEVNRYCFNIFFDQDKTEDLFCHYGLNLPTM